MRVLFLEIETEARWAVASVGPALLAAFVRPHGHRVEMLRIPVEWSVGAAVDAVRAAEPEILALSLTTRQWLRARTIVAAVRREVDVAVIAGGVHPTFAPADVLASPGFDYVCLGEGEEALRDLLAAGGRARSGAIPNLWVRGGPRPRLRPPLAPLDALPFAARDLLGEEHGVVHLVTQRGCPFPCTFCAAPNHRRLYAGVGTYQRRRSPGNVLAELRRIRRHGEFNYVIFLDDTFTIDRPWVEAFCRRYGPEMGVPFAINARVETVDRRLPGILAAAGCRQINYGVESGSLRVRRDVLRRPVGDESIADAFARTREAGIAIAASYMVGIPGETREEMAATLALHRRLRPDHFACFVYHPFPGTLLFERCRDAGYLPPDYRELAADHRRSILKLPRLTSKDIAHYYDRFASSERAPGSGRFCCRQGPLEAPRRGPSTSPRAVSH